MVVQGLVAQDSIPSRLVWKVNSVDLGTILEEEGKQRVTFEFTHTVDSAVWIERVWTDCGCTTVSYSQDSLKAGEWGDLAVEFDPQTAAGNFTRMILVKGNLAGMLDSLFLEGVAIPQTGEPQVDYPFVNGGIGFRLEKINMGNVFTNAPTLKSVDFFNFSKETLYRDSLGVFGPSHIRIRQRQDSIPPGDRGVLEVIYSGEDQHDLGFFEDPIQLVWSEQVLTDQDVIASVFDYYPKLPREQLGKVPALRIGTKTIDLDEIPEDTIQELTFELSNRGNELLLIKKIQGNCDCLELQIPKTEIAPGETVQLQVRFDPKGRRGRDQRNMYIFSNDPLNSVQTLIVKSWVLVAED